MTTRGLHDEINKKVSGEKINEYTRKLFFVDFLKKLGIKKEEYKPYLRFLLNMSMVISLHPKESVQYFDLKRDRRVLEQMIGEVVNNGNRD